MSAARYISSQEVRKLLESEIGDAAWPNDLEPALEELSKLAQSWVVNENLQQGNGRQRYLAPRLHLQYRSTERNLKGRHVFLCQKASGIAPTFTEAVLGQWHTLRQIAQVEPRLAVVSGEGKSMQVNVYDLAQESFILSENPRKDVPELYPGRCL